MMKQTGPPLVFMGSIGKGSFGYIRKARFRYPLAEKFNDVYAVKINVYINFEEAKIHRDIDVAQRKAKKSFFPSFIHYSPYKERGYLVMEYCEKGSLWDYNDHWINKYEQPMSDERAVFFMYQVREGIEFLHDKMIVHGDLKIENILLTKNWIAKIADFGVTTQLEDRTSELDEALGSTFHQGPEVLHEDGPRYSYCSDVWSFGVMVHVLVTEEFPFGKVLDDIELPFSPCSLISEPANNLLQQIFTLSDHRWNIKDISASEWIQLEQIHPMLPADRIKWEVKVPSVEAHVRTQIKDDTQFQKDTDAHEKAIMKNKSQQKTDYKIPPGSYLQSRPQPLDPINPATTSKNTSKGIPETPTPSTIGGPETPSSRDIPNPVPNLETLRRNSGSDRCSLKVESPTSKTKHSPFKKSTNQTTPDISTKPTPEPNAKSDSDRYTMKIVPLTFKQIVLQSKTPVTLTNCHNTTKIVREPKP